jgi:hypothetical protein
MNTRNAYAIDGFNIRITDETRCPHCDRALSPYGVERYDPGAWRVRCTNCHRDVLLIERAE